MSLSKKYKTDTKLASDGVWFEYKDQPNADKTIPAFKMARKSTTQNDKYAAAMREFGKDHSAEDLENMTNEQSLAYDRDVFLFSLLLDWRNFMPDDKTVLEYSAENAATVFADPDWADLYADLIGKCGETTAYKTAKLKRDAKK